MSLSQQEIFTTVVKHLRNQGRKAQQTDVDPDMPGPCLYKTKDGLKCAVGCLIPDHLYHPEMEGRSVRDMVRKFSTVRELLGIQFIHPDGDGLEGNISLLERLQDLHDSISPLNWEREFVSISEHYGFDLTSVQNATES